MIDCLPEAEQSLLLEIARRFVPDDVATPDDLDAIKAHAEARGESVNGFINRAVKEVMKKENGD